MSDLFDEVIEISVFVGKWLLFAVIGVVMFPAWLLIIYVHDKWIKLID